MIWAIPTPLKAAASAQVKCDCDLSVRSLRPARNREAEPASFAWSAFHVELAAVSEGDPARDGQPEAESRIRVVQLLPFTIQHVRQVLRRDTATCVLDRRPDPRRIAFGEEPYPSTGLRRLERVRHEIGQRLKYARRIYNQDGKIRTGDRFEGDAGTVRRPLEHLQGLRHECPRGLSQRSKREPPRLNACHV